MPLASHAEQWPMSLSLFSMKAATAGLLKLDPSSQCNKALWKKGQFSASYGNIENPGKAKLILNNKSTAGGVTTASLT